MFLRHFFLLGCLHFAGIYDAAAGREEKHAHHALISAFKQNPRMPQDLVAQVAKWEVRGDKQQLLKGWYANGVLALQAGLSKGKLHGVWQSWYSNGQRRDEGVMIVNIPDGEWKSWYSNGGLRAAEHFSYSKYVALVRAVKQRNPKRAFTASAMQAIATPGALEKITSVETHWPFAKGLRHGDYAAFFSSGQLAESGTFDAGLKYGLWQQFTEQGLPVSSGYYVNGLAHGPWKIFGERGQLNKLSEYKDGRTVYSRHYAEGE